MAKVCVFCGKELSVLNRSSVFCGVNQPACKNCSGRIGNLPFAERCQIALDSGRVEDATHVQAALDETRVMKEQQRSKVLTEKICLRCGGQMLQYGVETFKLGEETFFFSDLNRLASGAIELALLRCETCGKIEFFDPAFLKETNTEV